MNVSRAVYNGMATLHCSKREMLFMTPREFFALWNEHLEIHGGKKRSGGCSIDDLP